jgi:hypothetical protein
MPSSKRWLYSYTTYSNVLEFGPPVHSQHIHNSSSAQRWRSHAAGVQRTQHAQRAPCGVPKGRGIQFEVNDSIPVKDRSEQRRCTCAVKTVNGQRRRETWVNAVNHTRARQGDRQYGYKNTGHVNHSVCTVHAGHAAHGIHTLAHSTLAGHAAQAVRAVQRCTAQLYNAVPYSAIRVGGLSCPPGRCSVKRSAAARHAGTASRQRRAPLNAPECVPPRRSRQRSAEGSPRTRLHQGQQGVRLGER